MKDPEIKWLCIDTEWSYAVYYLFPSKKPQYAAARNIKHRQFCTNASWSWEHQSKVYNTSVLDDKKAFKKNFRDDRVCAIAMHKAMSEADVIVCHNEDFDLKMLNVVFALYGLGPIPEIKFICTLKTAKKHFRFAGNGLDDLLKFFGHKGKAQKPDWIKLTEGDPTEIKRSIPYCDTDVIRLKTLLKILKPYMKNLPKPRAPDGEFYGIVKCDCCGSKNLRYKGVGGRADKPYERIVCLDCNHPHKGKMKGKK